MRTKKAFKNIVFSIFQQIVGILSSFIIPPLIIGTFGSIINGLVATIKQLMNYVQLLGAGIASVSTYSLYEPLAKGDKKKVSAVYNASDKTFTKAGNIFSLVVLLVAIIYPLFVEKGINNLTVFLLVIVMGIAGASEFFIVGKYQALLNADQKNYLYSLTQAIGNLAYIAVVIILIKLKQNIVIVQLGASIIYVLRIIIMSIYVKYHYKYLDKTIKPDTKALKQRSDAIVHEVAALVIGSSSVVLISLILGLAEASVYSIYLLVFSGLNMICALVSNAIYASFGDAIARGELDVLKKSYAVYEWLYFMMIFFVFGIAYLLIDPFISVYTKNMIDTVYLIPGFGALFAISSLIHNLKVPGRTLIVAAGHFKKTRNRAIIEMVINLVAQIIFIPIFGLFGALIGNLASAIYRSIDVIIYTNKEILALSNKKTVYRIFTYSLALVFSVLLISKLFVLGSSNYLEWFILGIKISFLSLVINIIVQLIFEKKIFNETKEIIKRIKP